MPDPITRPVAQYLRMSTDHQKYSTACQAAANAAYAAAHGWEIIRTYTDEGLSGLTIKGRDGLKALLADALCEDRRFEAILVYDVSRWGRFQDPDEAAHYEFICRRAGARVHYTAEAFEGEGGFLASLGKHIKREMAAEFSRDLSAKITRAQRGLGAQGYWQGGLCGFGFRRLALNADGSPRALLGPGERNPVTGSRVTLVPGPTEEVAVVRRIFRWAADGVNSPSITARLNASEVPAPKGQRWHASTVAKILKDEKYAGVAVFGRRNCHLGEIVRAPRSEWIRKVGAFPAIVDHGLFKRAQRAFRRLRRSDSDEELLAVLRRLLAAHGKLSSGIIAKDRSAPHPTTFSRRFGCLEAAYAAAGYVPSNQQQMAMERIRRTRPDRARRRTAIVIDWPGPRPG